MIGGRSRAGWRYADGAHPAPVADMISRGRWACAKLLVVWGVPATLLVWSCSQGSGR